MKVTKGFKWLEELRCLVDDASAPSRTSLCRSTPHASDERDPVDEEVAQLVEVHCG
jgi:hypothetical protein